MGTMGIMDTMATMGTTGTVRGGSSAGALLPSSGTQSDPLAGPMAYGGPFGGPRWPADPSSAADSDSIHPTEFSPLALLTTPPAAPLLVPFASALVPLVTCGVKGAL